VADSGGDGNLAWVMAYKAKKNCVVWAIGGGLMGLVTTTLVMGLGQAAFIPFTSEEETRSAKAGGACVTDRFLYRLVVYGSLHPRLLAPWKQFRICRRRRPRRPLGRRRQSRRQRSQALAHRFANPLRHGRQLCSAD